jgi:mRNA-degrading endonuclease YafQ of YafQ-DinJ toxin-antitoxin module
MNITPNLMKARKIYKKFMTDYFLYKDVADHVEHVLSFPIYCCDVEHNPEFAKDLLKQIAKEAQCRQDENVLSAVTNILTNGREGDDPLKDTALANALKSSSDVVVKEFKLGRP